jgi:hypothetical protein
MGTPSGSEVHQPEDQLDENGAADAEPGLQASIRTPAADKGHAAR